MTPRLATRAASPSFFLKHGKFRRAAGFCNGRRPDFEFLSKENAAVAFQRSTMRATRRARGITLKMWRLCIPHMVVRGGGRATDPIRRHAPPGRHGSARGFAHGFMFEEIHFYAEFFRGTYFCTLRLARVRNPCPGDNIDFRELFYFFFFTPATNLQPSRSFPGLQIQIQIQIQNILVTQVKPATSC